MIRSNADVHQSVYKGRNHGRQTNQAYMFYHSREESTHMTTSKMRARLLDSPILTTIARHAGKAHTWIYRRTGGRLGGNLRLGAGFRKPAPTLLLEHQGRKSGKTFVSPLLYITDHSNVIVVASALGRT